MNDLTHSEFDAEMAKLDAALASGNWERVFAASIPIMANFHGHQNNEKRRREVEKRYQKVLELGRTASFA